MPHRRWRFGLTGPPFSWSFTEYSGERVGRGGTGQEKGVKHFLPNPLISMVRPAGFEPAAYGFVVKISGFHNLLNLVELFDMTV